MYRKSRGGGIQTYSVKYFNSLGSLCIFQNFRKFLRPISILLKTFFSLQCSNVFSDFRLLLNLVYCSGGFWSTEFSSHSLNLQNSFCVECDSCWSRRFSCCKLATVTDKSSLLSCSFLNSASNWVTLASKFKTLSNGIVGEAERSSISLKQP